MMCVCNEPIQNVLQDPVVIYMGLLLVFYLFNSQLLVQQYEKELDALRQELAMHDLLVSWLLCGVMRCYHVCMWWIQANRASVNYEPLTESEKEDIQRQVRQYVDGTLTEIEVDFVYLYSILY